MNELPELYTARSVSEILNGIIAYLNNNHLRFEVPIAMASNLGAVASNLLAMASRPIHCNPLEGVWGCFFQRPTIFWEGWIEPMEPWDARNERTPNRPTTRTRNEKGTNITEQREMTCSDCW